MIKALEGSPDDEAKARSLMMVTSRHPQRNRHTPYIITHGNFLKQEWQEASVVFFDATVTGPVDEVIVLVAFKEKVLDLVPGSFIIIMSHLDQIMSVMEDIGLILLDCGHHLVGYDGEEGTGGDERGPFFPLVYSYLFKTTRASRDGRLCASK